MPSPFQDLVASHLDPFVDAEFGEPFTLTPMLRTPNGRGSKDSERTVVNAVGVFHDARAADIEIGDRQRRGNDMHTLVNAPGFDLLVERRQLPNGARQGDQIEIRAACYTVNSCQFDGVSRWQLQLALVDEPEVGL